MTKRKGKGAYMISVVAEMYEIHPQTLRLYEREGLLKPSRSEGNTRLYTEDDLKRLEFILSLARDLGVNIAGIGIILNMRERMEHMQMQMQEFVKYVQQEVMIRANQAMPKEGLGAGAAADGDSSWQEEVAGDRALHVVDRALFDPAHPDGFALLVAHHHDVAVARHFAGQQ